MSDISFAVSEAAFEAVFNKIVPTPSISFKGDASLGPVWFGIEGAIHIDGAGDIDFESSNTFWLEELRIGWDKLVFRLGIDIPTVELKRFCILRVPDDAFFLAGKCLWAFPGGQIFAGKPDIGPLSINLNAIIPYVITEVTGRFKINLEKDKDLLVLFAHNEVIDIDPISISNTYGNLPAILQAAIASAAASYTKANPAIFLIDFALGELGFSTIQDLLVDLLDIPDDVEEWLMRILNVNIGVHNILEHIIVNQVLKKPIFEIPDPYEFIPVFQADIADYGEFTAPAPIGPQFVIETPRAPIINPEARFDADTLHIKFDFGI